MHASGYVVLLAGLPQYVRAAVVGDLAVELNTAVPSISDGVLAEETAGTGAAVRVGTEQQLPGSYTLLISADGGPCDPSSASLCVMQPGLISSSLQSMLAGKMVFELVDPNKPAAQAPSVAEVSADKLSLMEGSTQLLLNTTDEQPQDATALLAEPFASTNTVARNVFSASDQDASGLLDWLIPTRTVVARSRRSKEARPNKRPGRNITLNFGDDKDENNSQMLQTTSLVWVLASLVVLLVV